MIEKNNFTINVPEQFEKIGIGLPGGGFRAASFSMGILSFLFRVGLQKNIKALSTVSGGSITGCKYAEMGSNGKSFEEFYSSIYEFLLKNELLQEASKNLADASKFSFKEQNLINAFSLEYQKFIPGTFLDMEEGLNQYRDSFGLEEVIINATDFSTGLSFRFRTSPGHFGNFYYRGSDELKSKIKIGDALAASSCFPGGFEPILFPSDFYKNGHEEEQIALMDGGIIDNQGTSSFLTGINYKNDKDIELKYSLYVIGDAGKPNVDRYENVGNKGFAKYLNLIFNRWTLVFSLLFIVFLVYSLPLIFSIPIIIFVSVIATLQFGMEVLFNYAESKLNLKSKLSIPRGKAGIYLVNRISSMLALNNSIFLRGAKNSNIREIYALNTNKVIKPSIYDLTYVNGKPQNKKNWTEINKYSGEVSKFLQKCSEQVSKYPTTLWFNESREQNRSILNKMILTGEASCCFDILSHMVNLKLTDSTYFKLIQDHWNKINHLVEGELDEYIQALVVIKK